MKMVRCRVGWEDGYHWMFRDEDAPTDAHDVIEVPEVVLLQFEAWKDEGYLVWNKWLRALDEACYAAANPPPGGGGPSPPSTV